MGHGESGLLMSVAEIVHWAALGFMILVYSIRVVWLLREVYDLHNRTNLDFLSELTPAQARSCLTSLPMGSTRRARQVDRQLGFAGPRWQVHVSEAATGHQQPWAARFIFDLGADALDVPSHQLAVMH